MARGALRSICQAPTRGARRPRDPLITSGEWLCPRPSSSISSVALHDVPIGRGGRRASFRLHDPWPSHGWCKWARTGVGRPLAGHSRSCCHDCLMSVIALDVEALHELRAAIVAIRPEIRALMNPGRRGAPFAPGFIGTLPSHTQPLRSDGWLVIRARCPCTCPCADACGFSCCTQANAHRAQGGSSYSNIYRLL